MGSENPVLKIIFRTISNEEMASKMANMAKYGHFEYLIEYPIWVSIKRTLKGKLLLAFQNWIYCIRLKENVQKPPKIAEFWNTPF